MNRQIAIDLQNQNRLGRQTIVNKQYPVSDNKEILTKKSQAVSKPRQEEKAKYESPLIRGI